MKILGIIPARAGSKGVVGKNLKLLNGIPLLGYSIAEGLASKHISKVMVSTEDEKTAEISKELGAEVPHLRPEKLASDISPTIDTIVHVIEYYEGIGEKYDAICLLQPTVPFRKSTDIDKAIEKFEQTNADCLFSAHHVPDKYNPHWAFLPSADENTLNIATGENNIISRRQDLPKAYYRDGSIYITKTSVILEKKSLYGDKISYIVNEGEAEINIDTPEDWLKAESYIANNES